MLTPEMACPFEEIAAIVQNVADEYGRATNELGKFGNAHEGYAVILEELDELWDEIKSGQNKHRMKEEAVQVAAMAIRFIHDVC